MLNLVQTLLLDIVPRLARWLGFDGLFARITYRGIAAILCRNEDATPQEVEEALKIITPEQAQALKALESECCGQEKEK